MRRFEQDKSRYTVLFNDALNAIPITHIHHFELAIQDLKKIIAWKPQAKHPSFSNELKNHMNDILEFSEHPELYVKEDDFVAFKNHFIECINNKIERFKKLTATEKIQYIHQQQSHNDRALQNYSLLQNAESRRKLDELRLIIRIKNHQINNLTSIIVQQNFDQYSPINRVRQLSKDTFSLSFCLNTTAIFFLTGLLFYNLLTSKNKNFATDFNLLIGVTTLICLSNILLQATSRILTKNILPPRQNMFSDTRTRNTEQSNANEHRLEL